MWVPSVTRPSLSRRGLAAGDRGGEHERRVVGAVDRDLEERRIRFVEQLGDVDAGETRGHQAERGERRVAPADGRVGVEDGVAVGAGGHIERRAGVGHDDDALERGRCRGRGTPPRRRAWRNRSRRSSRTSTTTTSTVCVRPPAFGVAVEGGEHLAGGGRVEDDERHARRLRDDLGGERRAAHAGEHDARDALARRARRAAPRISATSGRETLTASTQPRRWEASASAAGPHSVGSPAVMPEATRSATRPGQRLVDDGLDVSAQVDLEAHRAISSALSQRGGDGAPAARARRR